MTEQPEPRVWFNGDTVPAGTWVYVVDETNPEHWLEQLDPDEDCGNVNLGPLVEIVLPADIEGIVARAAAARLAAS